MYTLSPRAAGVVSMPLHPSLLTVPGDPSTPAGTRYAAGFGNDFRQEIEWSPAHELQLLQILATAKPVKLMYQDGTKQRSRIVNVPAETVGVFLQSVAKDDATSQTFQDENDGYFDVVYDDGRQRRVGSLVGITRNKWIAREFVVAIWAEESDADKRRTLLRERLVAFGPDGAEPARMVKGAAASSLPPLPPGVRPPHEGEVLAPWLTSAYAEKLTGSVTWFNSDGDAIEINLRCDVRGEDVDLNDVRVLVNNLRGKAAAVETPMAVKAKQYQAALSAKGSDGNYVHTVASLAREIGTAPSNIGLALDYLDICEEVREAVDRNHCGEGGVSLKLAVTGRESICFGYDKKGDRHILSPKQQLNIWGELLKAFAVEDGTAEGIPDNASTRKILRGIKERELAGTKYAPSKAPERKPTKSDARVAAAAARVGIDLTEVPNKSKSGKSSPAVAEHTALSSSRSGAVAIPSTSSL